MVLGYCSETSSADNSSYLCMWPTYSPPSKITNDETFKSVVLLQHPKTLLISC